MGKECHPLLKGGRRESKYTHGLPSGDLATLASICEVFLPPIPQNSVPFSSKGGKICHCDIYFSDVMKFVLLC